MQRLNVDFSDFFSGLGYDCFETDNYLTKIKYDATFHNQTDKNCYGFNEKICTAANIKS